MDKQNQIGLDSVNNSGSGLTEVPWGAQQGAGAELKEVPFFQPTAPKAATTTTTPQAGATPGRRGGAIASDKLDAIAQREGLTPEQTRIWKNGILAQESGQGANSKTSVDGARGAGQVIPDTFRRFAKQGETIDNEDHNLAVSARIVKDLAKKFGDDPAKIAVGYFSGEGNVNTGKGNPYKADKVDGNGKSTSAYATDIVRRLTGTSNAQAAEANPTKIPTWKDITAKPEYAKLSPEDRQAAKEAYFDYYIAPIAGAESAALRTEFLAKQDAAPGQAAPAAPATPAAAPAAAAVPAQTAAVSAPSVDEVNPFAAAYGMVEGNNGSGLNAPPAAGPSTAPSAVVQSKGGSVMNTDTPLQGKPSSAFSPVRPEVRAALEGSWDAASAKERKRLEALPGWQGDIFRARAEGFRRQDNMGRDPLQSVQMRQQLEAAYDAASPEERQRLEALPGWQGDIFRQKRDGVFSIGKNQSPEFAQSGQTVQSADRRREAREAQLIGKGDKPEFAAAAAAAGAKRGATPGNEVGALEGVAQNSDFDFDTAKLFDPNERPNGLNNPLVRGVIKSGGDLYKFSTGLSEFAFDMMGADDMAKGMRDQANWIRAKENAMGEGGALKHVEGAIRSIASQMPFIASGSEPLALGGMALTVFGQEYSDGRAKGQTVGEASMRAGLYAIAELIGEKFSIGANMKAARALFDGAPVDQVAKLIGQILVKEVPGEALTTALEFGTDKLPGGVGLNTQAGWAEFAQQQAETFVQTVIQSGLMGGAPLARAHLSDKGGITERRLSEMRAMAAQDQALAKWEQFRQSIRPSEPSVGNPTQPTTSSRNEPTVGEITPSNTRVSPDGRVEPTLDGAQQSVPPGDKQAEDDLTDLAEVRRNQLRAKRDGTTAMVMTEDGPQEVEQPATALTPAEMRELDILEGGDWNAIRSFYFGNKPQEGSNESVQTQSENGGTAPGRAEEAPVGANGQPGGSAAVEEPATEAAGAQGSSEGGQRQPGNAAEGSVTPDEEGRLEREAIAAEGSMKVETPDDSDIPFDTKPSNGTQTTETKQAEAQGSQKPATGSGENLDYSQLTPEEFREKSKRAFYVPNGILRADLNTLSDSEVLSRFGRDDLATVARVLDSITTGTKAEILAGIRKIQTYRARLKDLTKEQLGMMVVADLRAMAKDLGSGGSHMDKAGLVNFLANWRDNNLKHSQKVVSEWNHENLVVDSVRKGNQNVNADNIRKYAAALWQVVNPESHPELYPKILERQAESLFVAPFDGVLPVIDSLRKDADEAKNDVQAQKASDLADALQKRYDKSKELSKPKTEKESQTLRKYEQSVKEWNALSNEYKTASDDRRAVLRPMMDALDGEQKRLKDELSRLGMQRLAQEGKEKASKKYGDMPIGTKIGMIGHESNNALHWEKTGDDEWTRRGMGSSSVTKTNAEMEGDRFIKEKSEQPKTEKESKEQKQATDLDAMFDDLLAEEAGDKPASSKKPKTEKEAKEQKSQGANEFVLAPNGSLTFGQINQEQGAAIRRQAGEIRLTRGIQNPDGTGYGLAHIEANHGDQIRSAGFESVESFVFGVATRFNEILQASGKQLLVAVDGGRKDVMFIQLEPFGSGEFYRVNTAFPASRSYLEKQMKKGMKLLWGGSEPTSTVAGQQPLYAGTPENNSGQDAPIAQGQSSGASVAQPQESTPQRSAAEAAKSAAKNTAEGFNNAIDGLGKLFGGGPGTLGSGPVFNEETYKKAKPLFQAAVANFSQAGADIREVMRAVIKAVLDKFGKQATENMKPYIVRFVKDYQEGDKTEPTLASAGDLHTPEGKMKVARELADFFIGGGSFASIFDARKKISDLIGKKIEAATELAKQADETIEVAIVLAGREIVQAGRKQGRSAQVIYDRLVDLYNRQPNLAVRSSTSVRDQAYSTPVPLAYLASELAGITYDSKVLEPTAGNGMLLVGVATKNATANELNGKRADMLDAMGFEAERNNAATESLAPAKSQDAVIANPPFGATKDAAGNTIVYEVKPDYGTREVDHAIAFKALEAMKDDGRAVLIVGGSNATTDEGRQEDYRGKSKRSFYFNLYKDYNVVDHFTVDGSMYSKQGASYPVDVIIIEGRGKSKRDLPAADLPQVIRSYEELKGKLNGTRSVESEGVSGADGASGSESAGGQDNGTPVDRVPGRPGDGDGNQGGAGSDNASVSGTESADNGRPDGSGAVSGDGQSEPAYTPRLRNSGGRTVPGNGKAGTGSATGNRGNRSGNVDGTGRVDGQRVESGLTDRRGEETETETQISYAPRSNAASVGTLVPRAMRDAIEASLEKIEAQFGNIDEYVAERLNYDPETLRANFSAEQVDALALAIKNAEEGRGFIIGDQTGIGKGRVVAAMIRYAIINDKTPIFVTEKPNLYSDMIRDLDDIGMTDELGLDTKKPKIFMTNADETVPYSLIREKNGEITENNLTLRPPKTGKAMGELMRQMMAGESLGDFKVIFTTYSQLQTVKGKVTDRMNFVKQFGAGNYMIFDESHNAGGGGETQARTKDQREKAKEGESLVTGRAAFVRSLVNNAFGTFFSSATYAKRPDVMDLYSSTNMKLAVDKISQLGQAIKLGGVPMQQVVATMLTKDGQYIRRERTFAGVSYDTVETKVDKQTAENMAAAMRAVLDFSRAKEAVIKQIQKEMDKEGALVKQMGGEKATIQGANFGSIMHNLIDQMLLSLKVQESVNHAIARLKAGEKVVMTVSNTMGSFLKDYAEEMGLNMGDPVALSFKDLYDRYLEKQRMVTVKDSGGNKTQRRLTDAELGPNLVAKFEAIRKQIADSGFGSAPISPIDYMHNELRKAGFKTDEITGRTVTLNYQSGTPMLTRRSADIRQRVKAVRGFNGGEVDVLILNQAGSTGLSLHASSKFKDQRKRHMIVVQAEKNIDTHMQMLGRVHRTGQIIPPAYSQMMADIPAEMRPAAVLAKKMASLSANTTASRKSAVSAEGIVDFMNDYGGQVAQEFLRDNPDILESLGGNKVLPLNENSEDASEDDIRKFTGYIPILPIKQQEQIYKDLIERYNELIERENTLGTNKLEAKAVDLDAKVLSSQQITENKGDPSIFASPANMEQVDVKRNVKPYTSAEVTEMVNERVGDKTGGAIANEMAKDVAERTATFEKQRVDELQKKEVEPVKIESQRSQINLALNHVRAVLQNYRIGDSIQIKDKNSFIVYGVITDIQNKGRTQNPAAGSAWKMQIALANGDAKSLTINFGQIGSRYELSRETRVNWYNSETQSAELMSIMEVFDKGSTARRDKRWLVTGNILAGFAKYPGQIIQYTKADGTTGQGVLMSRQFDFNKEQKNAPVTLKSGDQVMQFFREVGDRAMVGTPDAVLKIGFYNGRFTFTVPSSKREGGTYFLDTGITGALGTDFYKRGQQMQASTYSAEDAKAAIDYIIRDREDSIIAMSSVDKAREMFAPKPAQGQGGVTLNDIPSNLSSDAIFTTVPETDRVSALTRLKSLERKAAAGKITDAEYRLGIAQLIAQLQKRANERNTPAGDRVRGPDWIKERLLRARRTGELDGEMVDFAMWLLEKNPNLANDLAISIREGNDNTPAGSYQSLGRLMSLFKNSTNHGTAVHEILHHAERMMPLEIQQGISREWQRAWDAAYRKGDEKTRAALVELLKSGLGNKVSLQSVVQAFRDGTLNYEDHYQLTSPSEYWAVNATRIMAKRYGATTWQEKARNFLRDLIEYMKGALKFRSDTPILKGLRNVMNGNGQFISQKMLVEQYMEQVPAPKTNTVQPTEFMDIRNAVQSKLFRDRTKLSTFNWYDKSISTQLNKALKDADYAKVFGYVNAIQNEISLTSLRAAELAPGYLPRITDVKAAAKTLVVGRKSGAQQAKASQAVFAGTLAGDNVMEGKVWTEQELRNNFGLDDAGVALYFQARAAIDASLDEVAAAEAYAMAQGFVPKAMRRAIIDNPGAAETIISQSLEQQITKLQKAAKVARAAGNDQQAASMEETLNGFFSTAKQVEKIFTTARNLKAAGYAPLMRFGKYTVTVQLIDPATGNLVRDDEGNPLPAVFFGKFETEGEAIAVMEAQQMRYAGQDDIKISAGTASQQGYEMYSGISPETLALFAEALGAEKVMRKYIEEALSERSALKRRLERMGVEGYTQDMPRVLANFITSNARHAAKQYYMRDLNNAIKYIPKEKGDVRDEAIALREFALNSKDPGSVTSSIAFFWFLGGSVSSAAVNMTQPIMMTLPYLSQYGPTKATAAMTKALPIALGKQEMDVELKAAMRRASQEGVVDAQEIFHLYSQGAQSTATWLASALSKVPGAGAKIKAGSDSARARMSAFGVLWGSMFAAAEGFNRRLTFAAAWELAKQRGERNPYAFAVRAVNETQGIFNKANRPNWARQGLGRMAFTFKQYSIMYLELVKRMVKHGGPEGRRAALMMLVILMLLSGEEGLPFMQDLGDLIDTIGQFLGYNTNTMREKRKLAYDIIGKEFGDFALYGVSSFMPLDFQGRLGLGNLIPGTSLLKKSESDMGKVRSALEIIGPTASIGQQFGDAAEALSDENYGQAARNMAPTAVKNFLLGLDMLDKGYAVDAAGNRKVNTTPVDAVFKMVGFNPTVVAEKNRSQMPIRQDIELHNKVESSIVKQWARGYAEKDNALIAKAKARQADWNASNPENKIQIKAKQVVDAVQKMKMDSDKRLVKKAPPEMRKGIKESIKRDQGIVPEEPAEE